MAQRLVRRLCASCAVPDDAHKVLPEQLALPTEMLARWHRPVGCAQCQGTGYRGRIGIHEMVTIQSDLQKLIAQGANAEPLRRTADSLGRCSLRADGLVKAAAGLTTVDEVLRAAGGEGD
jgi:general secretion pathway protein E